MSRRYKLIAAAALAIVVAGSLLAMAQQGCIRTADDL